jgi:hypothetical protein
MTESKWASGKKPDALLDYHAMKKEPRKLRLLAAGCVRLLVTPETPALAGEILDVVERYADGAATRDEFLGCGSPSGRRSRTGPKNPRSGP